MDELVDIYNEKNEHIGVELKSKAHKEGLWHKSCHIWFYNLKNEVLLQLRAKCKEMCPDVWDVSAAGHIGAGEDVLDTAIREIKEELGVDVPSQDLKFLEIQKRELDYKEIRNKEFVYVYLLKFDGDPKDFVLQEEEVADARFFSTNKVRKGLKENPEKYIISDIQYWYDILDMVDKK